MHEGLSDWVSPSVLISIIIPIKPLSSLVGVYTEGFVFVQFALWNSSHYYYQYTVAAAGAVDLELFYIWNWSLALSPKQQQQQQHGNSKNSNRFLHPSTFY